METKGIISPEVIPDTGMANPWTQMTTAAR
jgi:hypothetical protein